MGEKSRIKKLFLHTTVIILFMIVAHLVLYACTRDSFSTKMTNPWGNAVEEEDLVFTLEDPDVLEITEYHMDDEYIYLTIHALSPGSCMVEITNPEDKMISTSEYYTVSRYHIISEYNTMNFTMYRGHLLVTLIALFLLTLSFGTCFWRVLRKYRYSYTAVFTGGFTIWLAIVTLNFVILCLNDHTMLTILSSLSSSEYTLMYYSAPVSLLFALGLVVSNIRLIRSEGKSFHNLLGILLAMSMVGGLVIPVLINSIFPMGSDLFMDINQALLNIYGAAYALLECFLFGAIICGTYAALSKPAMDKDYIIILGCAIRKDGTLYPLIRGRVDRAIAFYQKQLAATGKKAIFVPSGGQGPDEIMAEGDAMKKYLLEQGIPEAQILVENKSRNTRENMLFSRKLIQKQNPDARIAFSTTNYHVFRSGIIARQTGFLPEGMGGKTKWYFWPNAYVRECIGMIVYSRKLLTILFLFIAAGMGMFPFMYQ